MSFLKKPALKINTLQLIFISISLIFVIFGCAEKKQEVKKEKAMKTIANFEEFQKVVNSAGSKLLVFDLYADWCMPCRILSPLLEQVALEHKNKADMYKINVDLNPQISQMFKVRGIPYVVFMKNKQAIHAMTGVQPKEAYIEAIVQLAN